MEVLIMTFKEYHRQDMFGGNSWDMTEIEEIRQFLKVFIPGIKPMFKAKSTKEYLIMKEYTPTLKEINRLYSDTKRNLTYKLCLAYRAYYEIKYNK